MTFEYWLVIALDSEEIQEACLTEEEAITEAKRLKDSSGQDTIVEKVTLTREQVLRFLDNGINSGCGRYLEMFGLPEDYYELKEREEAEREIEELANFVEIMNNMNNE